MNLKKDGYPKGLLVRAVWECCDDLYYKLNRAPTRQEFYQEIAKREPYRIGISTHSRQWGEWMRHHKFKTDIDGVPVNNSEDVHYPDHHILLYAISHLGITSEADLAKWVVHSKTTMNSSDITIKLDMLTVNSNQRHLYIGQRTNKRSDSGDHYDLFFKNDDGKYELYIPESHGVWDIDKDGKTPILVSSPRKSDHIISQLIDELSREPHGEEGDFRRKALREVIVRQGQPIFRRRLIEAYEGRCAITGCSVQVLLEAAHITSYAGAWHTQAKHGLLLRADIHTLFDRGFLWIDAEYRVRISDNLRGTEFDYLDKRALSLPKDKNDWPLKQHLLKHKKYWNDQC